MRRGLQARLLSPMEAMTTRDGTTAEHFQKMIRCQLPCTSRGAQCSGVTHKSESIRDQGSLSVDENELAMMGGVAWGCC